MVTGSKVQLVEVKIMEIFSEFLHREVADSGKKGYKEKEELDR